MIGSDKVKHPKGLTFLFLSEMWERFGYYFIIGIFTLFLKDVKAGFSMPEAESLKLSGIQATLWDTYQNNTNFFLITFSLLLLSAIIAISLPKSINEIIERKSNKSKINLN